MLEEQIRNRIFHLMEQREMSLYRLALQCGIPVQTLYHMKRDATKCPNQDTIDKICKGLDITLPQFYDFQDECMCVSKDEFALIERVRLLDDSKLNRLLGYLEAVETE